MIKADLHMHSYYSDGYLSPSEVVRKQKRAGMQVIALTDHNSVKGVEEAMNAGKRLGIRVIPAVELTGDDGEILVYFINPQSRELAKFARKCAGYEHEKAKLLLSVLQKDGHDVSFKEMKKLFPNSINNYNLGHFKMYLRFKRWTSENIKKIIIRKKAKLSIGKVKSKRVSFLEIVRFSHRIDGVPVIAHPWFSKKTIFSDKKMKQLIDAGLKGLELDNGDRDTWGRDEKTVKRIRQLAKKYGLVLTKGTDNHSIPWMLGKGHLMGYTFCSERTVRKLEKIKKANT